MVELIAYYKRMGAPGDQSMLIQLLKESQQEEGGISAYSLAVLSEELKVKESFLLAVIRRIPSLRLSGIHRLELCAGPNCGKATALAAFAEKNKGSKVELKYVPCMRMCGKGPNLKFDGKLYHGADEVLLRRIFEEAEKS